MTGWATRPEGGAPWVVAWTIRLCLWLGWRNATILLLPITLWYFLTDRKARQESYRYLCRVLNRKPRWPDLFRHFHCFAAVTLDRLFLLTDRSAAIQIEVTGLDALRDVLQNGQGAILLGAHLGSFAVLRAIGRNAPVKTRAFMFRENLGGLTPVLDALAPHLQDDIIEIGATDAMLRVSEALGRGELIGMLADRAPRGERLMQVPFLGEDASFPTGPLLVAAVLGAPVLSFYGVRVGPGRYRILFEPFAARIVLPRADRQTHLQQWIGRYAARLEALCRAHPFNWFNFYDFWEPQAASIEAGRIGVGADG